jgi:hypothetical protein
MRSPTLSIDFSFRSILAFAPSQPLLSPCPACLRRKSSILKSLPPLEISCLSFCNSLRLFSTACRLFSQNAGGVYTLRLLSRWLRGNLQALCLCVSVATSSFVFIFLQTPFAATLLFAHPYKTPGGVGGYTSLSELCVYSVPQWQIISGDFPFAQSRGIVLTSQGDFLNVSE